MTIQKQDTKQKDTKTVENDKKVAYYQAVGRRKEASARVRLYVVADKDVTVSGKALKKGDIVVNGRSIDEYFTGEMPKKLYLEPLRTTNSIGRFAISALIVGGGLRGQLDAFIHGISRALETIDVEKYRPILKKQGFLTRDPRAKERRKAGLAQKARAKKQSPKR